MAHSNITWHKGEVSKDDKTRLLGFKNNVVWLTGLPGSGKSTIARILEKKLHERGIISCVLDGDNVRHGLNADLGFSPQDRKENIRRIREVTKLFYDAGLFVIVSCISPYKEDRDETRRLIGNDFIEIFVDCPLEICEKRDKKGLYLKACCGKISDFTGVNSLYEKPPSPEIVANTSLDDCNKLAEEIINFINDREEKRKDEQ